MKYRKDKLKPKKTPQTLQSTTHRVPLGCGTNMYITVSVDDENNPIEIFMNTGKQGTCIMAQTNALCRSISLGLRTGIPVKYYVQTLINIQCDNPLLGGVKSCGDGLAKVLQKYQKEK